MSSLKNKKYSFLFRLVVFLVIFAFSSSLIILPPKAQAQSVPILNLPAPGTMISMSNGFAPPIIRGLTLHADNPLRFDFIVDTGDDDLEGQAFEQEATKLIKYFLASLTVPEDEFWVNLSPYEKDRIIPEDLGVTELGRDLLGQDYILKQLTASLMYPEEKLGNKFWKRVYSKAQQLYGTTEIPVNTFNKVWIIPDRAVVYEHNGSAFVGERYLKVMLEEDYLAMSSHQSSALSLQKSSAISPQSSFAGHQKLDEESTNPNSSKPLIADDRRLTTEIISGVASEIVREVLIPELEKEVNEGSHFAPLRQIFNSMILATWYKRNFKENLLGQVYVDQNKVKGVDVQDKEVKQKIYNQYLKAFKQGVYNYIKEGYDPTTREVIPRKYFSGGVSSSPVMTVRNLEVQPLAGQPRSQQEQIVGPESFGGRNQRVTTDLLENAGGAETTKVVKRKSGSASSPATSQNTRMLSTNPEQAPRVVDEDGELWFDQGWLVGYMNFVTTSKSRPNYRNWMKNPTLL